MEELKLMEKKLNKRTFFEQYRKVYSVLVFLLEVWHVAEQYQSDEKLSKKENKQSLIMRWQSR